MKFLIKYIFLLIFLAVSFQNTYSQFGKNKVQYQDFDWKYIQSQHFDVYYNSGSKYLAEFTAINAEEALQSIQSTLNHRISARVMIILYNSHNEFQQTNVIFSYMPEGVGGVTELLKNRVVIPYQGNFAQLRHVIHHELVHAVLNDMFYGGTFQSAMMSGFNVQLPLWMNEGLAEWESIGGMNTETDMFMRDLTVSENLKGLEKLYGYLAYRGGQTFYWYIAEQYGSEKVGDLLNRLKISRTLNETFKSCFNESLEDFSEKWQKYLKKYYWTDLDIFEDPNDFAAALTNHKKDGNFYNSSPAVSPDGEKMAYIADDDGVFNIFIADLDKIEDTEKLISSGREKDFEQLNVLTPGISWKPDGTMLSISAKSGGEDAIYIVDASDGDYDKLEFGIQSISSVVWSPNGKMLAFIGSKEGNSDIYIYTFKTEKLKKITNDVFAAFSPVWSPDSRTLYFISDRGDYLSIDKNSSNFKIWEHDVYLSDIYSIDILSKEIKRHTFYSEYSLTSLSVSPDGSKLLYVSDKNGIGNIYELNLTTGESIPKTNSLNGITQISLASDGSKLLFTAQINAGYDIFLIRYPFEKNLDIDTLPLTKFRQSCEEQKNLVDDIVKEVTAEKIEEQEAISYGKFKIDFERQQLVKPNHDAIEKDLSLADGSGGVDYTDSSFIEKDYKISFSPDIVLGNPGYSTYWGFQGVTQMLFSDVLGDHRIYCLANILLDLRNSSFYFAYSYLPEIIDYQISAFQSAGFTYRYDDGFGNELSRGRLFRYRKWGAGVQASLPFDLFNRIEWGFDWINVSKEDIDYTDGYSDSKMLFVPSGRYVHDNVLFSAYTPFKGTRYFVGFKGVPRLSSSGIGFMTADFDFRHYIPIMNYWIIALRLNGGASFGPNPQHFYLGGTENWINATFANNELPIDKAEDYAFMYDIIKMPMRGFQINELSGSKFFITNVELRFPLFIFAGGPLPIMQSFMGALFFDMGGAWNEHFKSTGRNENGERIPNNLIMSSGIGFRSIFFGLPLKFDIAWRNEYHTWSKPEYLFSLGFDF